MNRNARQRIACNRIVTVAFGFSAILLNLKMLALMKWGKPEYPRKKPTRRRRRRRTNEKTQSGYEAEFGITTRAIGGVRMHNVDRKSN